MVLPPKLIVAPVDFSTHSHDAVNTAVDLARHFGSEICLVNVVPAVPDLPASVSIFKEAEYEQGLHADAAKQLAKIADAIIQRGIAAKCAVGTANGTAMEIIRIAEHHRADLMVIATHGMSGWRELAFGSVAEKVVRNATMPGLVLRAGPQQEPSKLATSDAATVAP